MTARQSDFTPIVDLLRELGTGPVRDRRPVYGDLLPPCNNACPAGENVQAWLDLAQAGHFREAWLTILRDNPMPAVLGRVCYHPCETGCNRAQLDSPISIHAVERFLGDMATEQGWTPEKPAPSSGKRVLVVGGGPSGLSAAYHLTRLGHVVEVHEAGPLPGGMLHFGIPAYRLPRAELMKEIARIEAMGVKIVLNHKVEDIEAEQAAGHFDAVFVAIGTQIGRKIDIPMRDAAKVLDAITLLHDVETGDAPKLGRRVIVYGGGNSAMDAARMARRLGAEETLIVYRRDRAHMPAQAFEADEALSEGVKIKWLSTIKDFGEGSLTVETMRLDEAGRAQPTGKFETLSADSVVLALGQQSDCGFLRNVPGIAFTADELVIVDGKMMTGHAGVFAGGDMAAGPRSVTADIGQGKKAARAIDAFLRGLAAPRPAKHAVVTFEQLHLPIYADALVSVQSELSVAERLADGFAETLGGLSEPEARHEAQRCLSCGNCFECDQCYAACPEQAILKLGPGRRYLFDYAKCTGCGVCFEQCPCHAIEMFPEPASKATEPSA